MSNVYLYGVILILAILVVLEIIAPNLFKPLQERASILIKKIKNGFVLHGISKGLNEEDLSKAVTIAGYSYDATQDIFYSNMDAWQRDQGYCRLYDESAAPFGMIIDCEPIYFEYDGKKWLIEFWKGQYDLCTGCELGIYTTKGPNLNIPGVFNGTFYHSASDEDRLNMSFILKRKGKTLFSRSGRHWWLTGFKLGLFSNPSDLSIHITISLKDQKMCKLFVQGLKKAGYSEDEFSVSWNTVSIEFTTPHTAQPITRTKETDKLIQIKNRTLCEEYNKITGPYGSFNDKLEVLKQQKPDLYAKASNIGKPKQLFDQHNRIKSYIDENLKSSRK